MDVFKYKYFADVFEYIWILLITLPLNEDSKAVPLTIIWATSWQNQQMTVCPAKTQISLGIRPVWSEASLCAQWVAKDPSFLHADSEDSESSLGAQSFCWFCHEAAHFSFIALLGYGIFECRTWAPPPPDICPHTNISMKGQKPPKGRHMPPTNLCQSDRIWKRSRRDTENFRNYWKLFVRN